MNSNGALSASTRSTVMNDLFNPVTGIGFDFLRNRLGASDLARYSYTFDDMPAGQTGPNLTQFSVSHDLADVLPLTKQAQQLNPGVKVMASPWTAPSWMKDSGAYSQYWLQSQYYAAYAQDSVKYIRAYQAHGVSINYVSVQNEPTCCSGYPSMQWNGSGLDFFTGTNLLPALHSAGLGTKVLALEWNSDTDASYGAPSVNDATVRNDSLFGGIAWHGYGGRVTKQNGIHNQYPSSVPNVAWLNPDGSKAPVTYNVRVHPNADRQLGRRALLILPARADVRGLHLERFAGYWRRNSHRPDHGLRRQVRRRRGGELRQRHRGQLYDCNGTAQSWTVATGGSLQALGTCMDITS